MKPTLTIITLFLCSALWAQNISSIKTSALLLSSSNLKNTASHVYRGNVLMNRLPASAPAVHNSAYKAGVALLVLGPVKMAVGMGVLGWSAYQYHNNVNVDGPKTSSGLERGVAFGVALGTFHLLTGAALTAGGVVLLRKSRRGNASYLTLPEPTLNTPVLGFNNGGAGLRTAIVF
jgi:hypothetical protein